jgi:hypothetical protein
MANRFPTLVALSLVVTVPVWANAQGRGGMAAGQGGRGGGMPSAPAGGPGRGGPSSAPGGGGRCPPGTTSLAASTGSSRTAPAMPSQRATGQTTALVAQMARLQSLQSQLAQYRARSTAEQTLLSQYQQAVATQLATARQLLTRSGSAP